MKHFLFFINIMACNPTREIFKYPKKKFKPILADYAGHQYQIDLIDYRDLNVKWVLTVIDVYSRKTGFTKISLKKASFVLVAFKKIIKDYFGDTLPKTIAMDSGSEFKDVFAEYLAENDITIYLAPRDVNENHGHKSATSIVERVNRTFRIKAQYLKEDKGVTTLQEADVRDITNAYNDTKHRTLSGDTPNMIWNGTVPRYKKYKWQIADTNLKVGDHVRVSRQLKQMEKSRKKKNRYSRSVFRIEERRKNRFTLNNGLEYPYGRLMKTSCPITEEDGDDGLEGDDVYNAENAEEEEAELIVEPEEVVPRRSARHKNKRVQYGEGVDTKTCLCRSGCRFCGCRV